MHRESIRKPMTKKFSYAECFHIDPEGKNVVFVYYPESIDIEQLEDMQEAILRLQDELNEWAKNPDSPIHLVSLPWGIRIKIEKVTRCDVELSREGQDSDRVIND
jgi:hypothetical protein